MDIVGFEQFNEFLFIHCNVFSLIMSIIFIHLRN